MTTDTKAPIIILDAETAQPDSHRRREGLAMYHTDPLCHCRVRCVRLWPWVLSGLIVAGVLWLYVTPIPDRPNYEPFTIGPDSPLYGPMKGVKP